MTRRRQLIFASTAVGASAGFSLLQGCWSAATDMGLKHVSRTSRVLGADVTMAVLHQSRSAAMRALDAAFGELELVDDLMSLYRPLSQISRLNRARALDDPHPCFVSVLELAQRIAVQTSGALM